MDNSPHSSKDSPVADSSDDFARAAALESAGALDDAEALCRALTEKHPDRADGWRLLAKIAQARGDGPALIASLQRLRQLAPEDDGVALDSGHILREAGCFAAAEAVFTALAARRPDWGAPARGLGLLARQTGDRAAALTHFLAARERDAQDPWIAVDLGHAWRETGRLDRAEAVFAEATQDHPDFCHGWRGRGVVAQQRGDYAAAVDCFSAACHCAPADRHFAVELGHALRNANRLDEARTVFEGLIAEEAEFAPAWRGLGLAARQSGDRSAALTHFAVARRFDARDPWIALDLGHELLECGRLEEAEEVFAATTDAHPVFDHGWRGRAIAAQRRGDLAAAIEALSRACACAPNDRLFAIELGHALREAGRLNEARAAFDRLIRHDPDFAPAWRGRGLVARQSGDRAAALENFVAARRLDPADRWIALDLGHEWLECGRLAEAEDCFRRLTREAPDFAHAWRGLSVVRRQRGDRAAALDHIVAAFARDPNDCGIAIDLGHELREAGRLDEAEAEFRRLVERLPDFAPAWRGLGMVFRARGAGAAAQEFLAKARGLAPDDPWIALDIGHNLRELGQLDEAEATFRDLVDRRPDFVHGWRGLAQLAGARGDKDAAIELYLAAQQRAPGDRATEIELGHALREAGRLAQAEALFQRLIADREDDSAGWRGLGLVARARGDRVGARRHFAQAQTLNPDDPWIALDLAYECRELGATEQAEQMFAELTRRLPAFAHGWRGLGVIRRELGRPAEALEDFCRAADLEPREVNHRLDIVSCLRALGLGGDALAAARAARSLHPRSGMAVMALAELSRGEASVEQVLTLLRQAARLEPDQPFLRAALGDACVEAGRLDEAAALFDDLLARDPDDASALLGKSRMARRKGERAAALAHLQRANARRPWHEGVAQDYALELAATGRRAQAEEILAAAMAARLGSPTSATCLGHVARLDGDFSAARECFAQVVARSPQFAPAQIELAEEDFRVGRLIDAVERLGALHRKQPSYAPALERLAEFCARLDDLDGALELRRRALAFDRGNFRHALEIGRIEAALGRSDDALRSLDQARKSFGLIPDIALRASEILAQRGESDAALDMIVEAAAQWPSDFEVWIRRIGLLIETGDFGAAENLLAARHDSNRHEQGRIAALTGQLRAAQWRPAEALDQFLKAAQEDPANAPSYEWAARMALALGDLGAAETYLRRSKAADSSHLARYGGVVKPSQTHVGQLLDEYRIDAEALAALRAALDDKRPTEASRIATLDFPDYTPAAIAYLVALRRQGDLSRGPDDSRGGAKIPRHIHQFWDKTLPDDVAALCASWREQNPDYRYRLFSLGEARAYLRQIDPKAQLAFDRAREPAMKADIFRLAALWREGGVYADADDAARDALAVLLRDDAELALYQEDYGTVGNNFIAARPGHPVLKAALEQAVDAINRGDSDIVWLSTGPGLLTRCVARFLAQAPAERLAGVQIMERHELRRAVAMHCPASYKHSARHWSRSSFNASASFRRSLEALSRLTGQEAPNVEPPSLARSAGAP